MSRLGTTAEIAGAGLLAAGLVGVLRQRQERQRVADGRLAPVTSATFTVPATRQGPLARRASTWEPQRPTTGAGRVAAAVWAAPNSLVGALVAATTGGRPRWDEEHGCIVVEGGSRGSVRLLRAMGLSANAIGHVVVSRFPTTPPNLLAHEAAHVRQAERLGPLLLPAYLWWLARYGYRDHPLERGARAAARGWAARHREPN